MIDIMKSIFNLDEDNSKDVAKERLRLILVHDRIGVSKELIEDMKGELIEVVAKYLEIDEAELDMELAKKDNSVALIANIPIKKLKEE